MKNRFWANYGKIAVIAIALAVAATCTVSGTLAAFSATYTWNSDSASVGDITYRDTVYSFGLFNDEYITPGDSGSAVLKGADFGLDAVVWSFESHNEHIVPVVFYTLGEDGKADISSFYSEYAFAGMEQYYVRCADGTVASLSVVSSDPVVIAQSLGIGKTLCWAWFEEFFTDAAATAQASGSAVEAYNEYCKEICVSEYAFAPELAAILNDALALAFVTGTEGDSLVVNTYSPTEEKRVENGLVTFGADVCHVYSYGMFVRPSSAADLMEGSAVWLLVPETEGTSDATDVALTAAGITYEKGGLYTVDGTVDNASKAVPDEAGNRRLYKIYPSLTDTSRAQISVTISATVTV